MTIPKKIILTGKIYIKYEDDIANPVCGDVLLYLNDDAINPFPGDYYNLVDSGYIKACVYDGKVWQNMDICEFCINKEKKYKKKQRAIDSAMLCKSIMEADIKGVALFRTYRAHYTRYEYEQQTYDRGTRHGRKA